MKKESLNDFFIAIKPFGELWSPVKNGDSYVLDTIKNYSDIDLSALRTKIPFKKLLLPPKFSMFSFDSTGIIQPSFEELTDHVIFGMYPCDIHALMIPDNFLPCIPVIPTTWSR